ncbi:MAG: polyketide synthase dehydratase domain-containing protein [Pseudomonadota bacterium]
MSDTRIPLTIRVQPWYQDHSVDGRIVLPAVETMLLLAARCLLFYPATDIRVMDDVRFGKFLEIPAAAATIAALVAFATDTNGRVQAKLLSHLQLGRMSRIKEHSEMFFPPGKIDREAPTNVDPAPPSGTVKKVDVEHIYRELVPFGRYYHTLKGNLYLSDGEAWGELQAPELPFTHPIQVDMGSPFPLDGALHAACVLGQEFVDFPPFPVGFARRIIFRPTQPGRKYFTRVTMTSLARDELVFDLQIFDSQGQIFETVGGLRMRDVSKAMKKQTV